MDVDAVRKRSTTALSCHRCGELGHFAKDCARRFDMRYMTTDEQEEWIQHAMVARDVAEVEHKAAEAEEDVVEDFGVDNE